MNPDDHFLDDLGFQFYKIFEHFGRPRRFEMCATEANCFQKVVETALEMKNSSKLSKIGKLQRQIWSSEFQDALDNVPKLSHIVQVWPRGGRLTDTYSRTLWMTQQSIWQHLSESKFLSLQPHPLRHELWQWINTWSSALAPAVSPPHIGPEFPPSPKAPVFRTRSRTASSPAEEVLQNASTWQIGLAHVCLFISRTRQDSENCCAGDWILRWKSIYSAGQGFFGVACCQFRRYWNWQPRGVPVSREG